MKLVWRGRDAQAAGWAYAIQTEQVRGEPPFHSLLVKPPGAPQYYGASDLKIDPPIPDIGLNGEGTMAYVRREAQAHADIVVT